MNILYALFRKNAAFAAVLLFLAMAASASAQSGSIATISDINGKVIVQREDAEIWEVAGEGAALAQGDSVKARSDSHAIVKFSGGDYFKLMPLSQATVDVIDENSGAKSNVISLKAGKIWAQAAAEDSSERLIVEAGETALDITDGSIFIESATGGAACVDVLAGIANARGFSAPDTVEELETYTRASLGDGVKTEKNIASGATDALSESYSCMKESAVPDTQELVQKAIDELGNITITALAQVTFTDGDAALAEITEMEKSVSAAGDEITLRAKAEVVFADAPQNENSVAFAPDQEIQTKYVDASDVVVSVFTTVTFQETDIKHEISGTSDNTPSCRSNGQSCGSAADCCSEICNSSGLCADTATTTLTEQDEKNPEEVIVVIVQTTNVQFICSAKPEISDVSVNGQKVANGGVATIEGGECEREKQAEITWSVAPKCGALTANSIKIGSYENNLPGVDEGQKLAQTEQSTLFSEDPTPVKFRIADKFGNETTYSISLKYKRHASLSEPPVVTSIIYSGQDVSAGDNVSATIDSCEAGSFAISGIASSKCWNVTSVSVLQDGAPLGVSGAAEWSSAHTVKSADGKSGFVVKAKDSNGKESAPVAFNISYKVSEALIAPPTIEEVSYDAQSIDSGDIAEVEIKDCSTVSRVIKGKASSPCGGAITMTLTKDGKAVAVSGGAEWTAADSVKYSDKTAAFKLEAKGPSGAISENFEFSVEPKLDIAAPEAQTTTIAKTTIDDPGATLTFHKSDLESGKLSVKGTAASDNSCAVSSVEVSTDDGGSWSKAVGTTSWTYSFTPSENTYNMVVRAANEAGVVSDAGSSIEVVYKATTNEEDLRAAFEKLVTAYKDKQTSDFIDNTSDEFSSNYEGLRDIQELEESLNNQSKANQTISLRHSVSSVTVSGDTGSVVFRWTTSSSSADYQYQANFDFKKDSAGQWLFSAVKDDNTFLRYTSVATSVTLSIADTEATADETGAIKLTVNVKDSAGNQIKDGTVVSFTTNLGRVSPSTDETSGGVAEADFFPESKVGTASIFATSGGVKSNTVAVSLLPGAPSSITITSSTSSMTANGSGSATITATVKDAAGNNVANGTTVTFETTHGTITASSATTSGVASATFAGGTVAGSATISADSGTATSNNLTIAVNPGAPASLSLTSLDSSLVANGTNTTTLAVDVKDANGNDVADGTVVTFTTTVGTITASDTTVGGTAEATLTATAVGTASVRAVAGTATSNTVTITLSPEGAPQPPGMRKNNSEDE